MFDYAMLIMAASASILGLRSGLTDGNVMGALMTAYFVGTALTTVRPASPWPRRINAAALTFALGLAIVVGVNAVNSPRVSPGGVPVSHDRCDVLHPCRPPAPGCGGRRARHAIRDG
jgi:hypothetical protein